MFNNYKRQDAIIIVVGNKTDLKDRKTSQETAFDFALKEHLGYSEVSAKRGEGIETLFESIIANILVTK
jgi:predicted GTPase